MASTNYANEKAAPPPEYSQAQSYGSPGVSYGFESPQGGTAAPIYNPPGDKAQFAQYAEQAQPFMHQNGQNTVIVTQPGTVIVTPRERIAAPVKEIVLASFVTFCCCCCLGIPALILAIVAIYQSTISKSEKMLRISKGLSISGFIIGLIYITFKIVTIVLQMNAQQDYDNEVMYSSTTPFPYL